jgi:peptide/nickel transport system substrate-binding protein
MNPGNGGVIVKKTRTSIVLSLSLMVILLMSACQTATRSDTSGFEGTQISASNCDYGGELKSIEAVDQYTVRFTLCYPDASFPAKLAHPAFSIFDGDFLDTTAGDSAVISESPVGTGPYMLSDAVPGSSITLVANPNYWGTPPKTSEIVFSWSDDPFHLYVSVQTHTVNAADNIDPADFGRIRNNNELELHFRPLMTTYYIGFNNQVVPFDNVNVRIGFAQSIDRSSIVSAEFPEGSSIADQFLPRGISPGFSSGLPWYVYDLDDASQSFSKGSYDFSQVFNLYYIETPNNQYPDSAAIADYVSNELLDTMNIKIHPQAMTEEQFMEDLSQGQLGMFLFQTQGYYPDATNFYDRMFIQNGSYFGIVDENLVAEIRAAEKIADIIARQQHYDVVNQLIKTNVLIIPIGYKTTAVVNRASLENVIVGPFNENFPEMGNLTDQVTFMQSAEPFSLNPLDETDRDTIRVASLIYNTLVNYQYGGFGLQGGVADSWSSNSDLTQWTFNLHYGVTFNNGATFDANDVVATFKAIWDASSPNHTGRTGEFKIFQECFGNFLNAEP